MKQNKTMHVPNECSGIRWGLTLVAGLLLGAFLTLPLSLLLSFREEALANVSFLGLPLTSLLHIASFGLLFWSMALALKWVAKTSLRDFILGQGGRADLKECLLLLGLQAVGLALSFLPSLPHICLRDVAPGTFAVLVVTMLLLIWMQTTFEELVFRGIFLRWACKNKLGYTGKAFFGMAVSALSFAAIHMENPEVGTLDGASLLLGFLCYALPGALFYLADICSGNLLPGIVLHWANNLLLFTVISSEVTALPLPTLLVSRGQSTGLSLLFTSLLAYVPASVYFLFRFWKGRRQTPLERSSQG